MTTTEPNANPDKNSNSSSSHKAHHGNHPSDRDKTRDRTRFKNLLNSLIKSLASIKLAVIIIFSLALITAVGTFVEAKYSDAQAARKLVYDSIYMNVLMGIFAINLIAVMVDRWPWKLRHTPFICAHIGILVLMTGQLMTGKFGVDGTMRVEIGSENRYAQVPQKDLLIYSSFDGNKYTKLLEREVDFFSHPPDADHPYVVLPQIADGGVRFVDYYPYAVPSKETIKSDNPRLGAGVRIQLTNGQANFIEWLVQRNPTHTATQDLGRVKIHLGPPPQTGVGINEIYLTPIDSGKDAGKISYVIYAKESIDPRSQGVLEEGKSVPTGWMGLELKILRFFPHAEEKWKVEKRDYATPVTTEAVQIEFQGQKQWMLLNDTLKLFTKDAALIVVYGNRRVDIGFNLVLDQFIMDKYQGTSRAKSYKSIVTIPEKGQFEISMNEPLKYQGMTVYQASFQDGPMGQPVASVFSINKDPGRWVKYLGSLIMSIGIILLFYFRKMGIGKKNT